MKKINLILFLFLGLASTTTYSLQDAVEKTIDMAFSKASRELLIDYNLLVSIGEASSETNPFYVKISGEEVFIHNEKVMHNIVTSDGWIITLRTGNNKQTVIADSPQELYSMIERYGSSRDYSLIKIKPTKIRYGIMSIPLTSLSNFKVNIQDNIYEGSKRFKSLIGKMGLKNSIYEYCECQNSDRFYRSVAAKYKKLTDKNLSDLFSK